MKTRIFIISLCLAATLSQAAESNHVIRSMSLRSCIEHALADNLEIRFERINPGIASWGVVQQQGVFDPAFVAAANYNDSSMPLLSGGTSNERQFSPSLGLTGVLPTGTGYGLSVADSRTGGSSINGTGISDYTYTGAATLTLTQPLLKNFGLDPNLAQIRVAHTKRDIAIQNFAQLVMSKISAVSKAYCELVFAIEDYKAQLESLTLARRLLDENRKRVQVGVLSPLDVTQAEAGAAEREEAVIIAERTITDNENILKRLIASDVRSFQGVSLQPTDFPLLEIIDTDVARSTRTALEQRPEYRAAVKFIEQQHILVEYNRNQLWPELDLQGSYGMNGLAYSGFHTLTSRQLGQDNPAWGVGLSISFPLGNRKARANYNIARLDREQALISLKQLEQNIVVEVDNAVRLVRTNLKRVEATRVASRLARESLAAEETKLRAGTSTSFLVLQAQSQLATALSAEQRARADYSESLVALALSEGTILQKNNIVLDEKF